MPSDKSIETDEPQAEQDEKKEEKEKVQPAEGELNETSKDTPMDDEAETSAKPSEANEPEKPKESEEDAPEDTRPKVEASSIGINTSDSTLNVMPTAGGKLLMTLTDGGFQYLVASARTNVGVKSGRYMFEVKIVESLNLAETHSQSGQQGRSPQPRQLFRVGFSLAGSSLFLGSDSSDNVCFDSEGYFTMEKKRTKITQRISRDQTIGVLLNLDAKSANANTISLFKDGVRICKPQSLPASLLEKALFPTISYKNVTLNVNFGPAANALLPFTCCMLANAAKADVEIVDCPVPATSKCEVVFPVGLPGQGYFDWVDSFREQNPAFVELSDRQILLWATKSGIWRPKGYSEKSSRDKPDMKFGIPLMDDNSVSRVLAAVAPTLQKNYVVAELLSNLLPDERKELLKKFPSSQFKKTALVIMGEPNQLYKDKIQSLMLADKKSKALAERKRKAQEDERTRLMEERKKKAEEAKKSREAAQRGKAADDKEAKQEKEGADGCSEENKESDDVAMGDDVPEVALTEEEKARWHRSFETPDIMERALSKSFASFALPSLEEGFDDIKFDWKPEKDCKSLLDEWIRGKKLTQRVEDLKPGEEFKQAWSKWQKTHQEWKKRQQEYKDPAKRKALLQKKKEELKKKMEEDAKEDGEKKEDKEPELMHIDAEDIDIFAVQDVTDLGSGEPLFSNFAFEDWTLLSMRVELHLLLHAFKKDLDDPDRPSFSENHMPFYYHKYFNKQFSLKHFGLQGFGEFLDLIKDTMTIEDETKLLKPALPEDTDVSQFVKLAEDHRRDRQRRIDAGDETAQLKFTRPAPPPPRQPPPQTHSSEQSHQQSRYGGSSSQRSGYYGSSQQTYGAQKRPYSQNSSGYSQQSKHQRTSYSGSGYGRGGGGGGGGGGGYYRR